MCKHRVAHFDCANIPNNGDCGHCGSKLFFLQKDFDSYKKLKNRVLYDVIYINKVGLEIDKLTKEDIGILENTVFSHVEECFFAGCYKPNQKNGKPLESLLYNFVVPEISQDLHSKLTDKDKKDLVQNVQDALGEEIYGDVFTDVPRLKKKLETSKNERKRQLGLERYAIFEIMMKNITKRFFKKHELLGACAILSKTFTAMAKGNK